MLQQCQRIAAYRVCRVVVPMAGALPDFAAVAATSAVTSAAPTSAAEA
jgi:hypothetical protein